MSKTTSQPKLMMIKFLQGTRLKSDFKFKLQGDEEEARKFIHRMRVELARMRTTVKESGRVPKEFKMLLISIEFDSATGSSVIALDKSEGKTEAIAEELTHIFDDIAGGRSIN